MTDYSIYYFELAMHVASCYIAATFCNRALLYERDNLLQLDTKTLHQQVKSFFISHNLVSQYYAIKNIFSCMLFTLGNQNNSVSMGGLHSATLSDKQVPIKENYYCLGWLWHACYITDQQVKR